MVQPVPSLMTYKTLTLYVNQGYGGFTRLPESVCSKPIVGSDAGDGDRVYYMNLLPGSERFIGLLNGLAGAADKTRCK